MRIPGHVLSRRGEAAPIAFGDPLPSGDSTARPNLGGRLWRERDRLTRHADQVIVLDAGRIAEIGTHRELAAHRGLYFELVRNQLDLAT